MVNWIALTQVGNLDKIVLYIIGFFVFVAILISVGVAGYKSAISMIVGIFMVALAGYGMIKGTFSWQIGIFVLIIGIFLAVVNPSSMLALDTPLGDTPLGEFYKRLGLIIEKMEVKTWT
jgi:membrane-bound ClpP family serine protease